MGCQPWNGGAGLLTAEAGGWQVVGPSAIPFDEGNPTPKALSEHEIDDVVSAFESATKRALALAPARTNSQRDQREQQHDHPLDSPANRYTSRS